MDLSTNSRANVHRVSPTMSEIHSPSFYLFDQSAIGPSSISQMTQSSSLTQVPTPPQPQAQQSKRASNRQTQLCSVCGDRAYYVFYGAVACDSCRTFFRRQVLHSKPLTCHVKNNCSIQLSTRKDCAKCRLNKCLSVGMKQSLVAIGENDTIPSTATVMTTTTTTTSTNMSPMSPTSPTSPTSPLQTSLVHHRLIPTSPTTPTSIEDNHFGRITKEALLGQCKPVMPQQPLNTNPIEPLSQTKWAAFASNVSPSDIKKYSHPKLYYKLHKLGQQHQNQSSRMSPMELPLPEPIIQRPSTPQKREQSIAQLNHSSSRSVLASMLTSPSPLTKSLKRPPASTSACVTEKNYDLNSAFHSSASSSDSSSSSFNSITPDNLNRKVAIDAEQEQGRSSIKVLTNSIQTSIPNHLDIDPMMEDVRLASDELTGKGFQIALRSNDLVKATKLLYFGIRRVVSACRHFRSFYELSEFEQRRLLRYTCSEMLILRSLFHANLANDTWEFVSNNNIATSDRTGSQAASLKTRLPVSVLLMSGGVNFYHEYRRFVTTFPEKWRKDSMLLTIMMAIILFDPTREEFRRCQTPTLENDEQQFLSHVTTSYQNHLKLLKWWVSQRSSPSDHNGQYNNSISYQSLLDSIARLKMVRSEYETLTLRLSSEELDSVNLTFTELSI